jgi:hypothetical protein
MSPDSRPAPRYGLISVAAPFLGVFASFGFLMLTGGFLALGHWPDLTTGESWLATLAMVILTGSCLTGLASAFAAFVRPQESCGLAVIGLILNALLPALLLGAGLEGLLDWLRYG